MRIAIGHAPNLVLSLDRDDVSGLQSVLCALLHGYFLSVTFNNDGFPFVSDTTQEEIGLAADVALGTSSARRFSKDGGSRTTAFPLKGPTESSACAALTREQFTQRSVFSLRPNVYLLLGLRSFLSALSQL